MRGFAAPAVRVVALLWALAALALALSQAIRANPNSVLALIAAGLLAGTGLVWLLTLVIQRVDGAEVGGWGYEREMLVLALLVLSLAVPWRIEVRVAHAGAIVGWSTAIAWLTALGLVPTLSRRIPGAMGVSQGCVNHLRGKSTQAHTSAKARPRRC